MSETANPEAHDGRRESPRSAIIGVRDLGITFDSKRTGPTQVLRDLNIKIQEGEFVSLVGASGCGKTTLLRALSGLVEPATGEVLIDGRPVHGMGSGRAMVFQQDGLFPWRTVSRNVRLGLEVTHVSRHDADERVMAVLGLVGLEQWADHYPHELSGGMRQRVNLARALVQEPRILLMDEPFAALDAQTRELMQQELLRLWGRLTATIIFVTHQIDEALYLSDRVITLGDKPGRVKREFVVPFDRPRELSLKRAAEFGEMSQSIWELIEADVKAAFVSRAEKGPRVPRSRGLSGLMARRRTTTNEGEEL